MLIRAIALTAAGLLVAGQAAAAGRISDVDYLRASRCRGLADSLPGVVDSAAMTAFVKSAGATRDSYIGQRASEEYDRARRDARNAERKDRLTAELAGPCAAFLAKPADLARR